MNLQSSWEKGSRWRKNTAEPIAATLTRTRSNEPLLLFSFSLAKSGRRLGQLTLLQREKKQRGWISFWGWARERSSTVWEAELEIEEPSRLQRRSSLMRMRRRRKACWKKRWRTRKAEFSNRLDRCRTLMRLFSDVASPPRESKVYFI